MILVSCFLFLSFLLLVFFFCFFFSKKTSKRMIRLTFNKQLLSGWTKSKCSCMNVIVALTTRPRPEGLRLRMLLVKSMIKQTPQCWNFNYGEKGNYSFTNIKLATKLRILRMPTKRGQLNPEFRDMTTKNLLYICYTILFSL